MNRQSLWFTGSTTTDLAVDPTVVGLMFHITRCLHLAFF